MFHYCYFMGAPSISWYTMEIIKLDLQTLNVLKFFYFVHVLKM